MRNPMFELEWWRARQDLNPRHRGPKPRALSVLGDGPGRRPDFEAINELRKRCCPGRGS
jgi:hypothetical protein